MAHLEVARQNSPEREHFLPRAKKKTGKTIAILVPRQCRAAVVVATALITVMVTLIEDIPQLRYSLEPTSPF